MKSRRINAREFANGMRLLAINEFSTIPDTDFDNIEKSEALKTFLEKNNKISDGIKLMILSKKSAKKRAKKIKYFIDVIKYALKNEDYFTAITVMGTIRSSDISQLRETNSYIDNTDFIFLDACAKLFGSGKLITEKMVSENNFDKPNYVPIPALKSIFIAYNEAIEQNRKNIFDRLKTDPFPKNDGTPLEIFNLLTRKNLLELFRRELAKEGASPSDARLQVEQYISTQLSTLIERYKDEYRHKDPSPDANDPVLLLDYDQDIKGKVVKIIDAAISIDQLKKYSVGLAQAYNIDAELENDADLKKLQKRVDEISLEHTGKSTKSISDNIKISEKKTESAVTPDATTDYIAKLAHFPPEIRILYLEDIIRKEMTRDQTTRKEDVISEAKSLLSSVKREQDAKMEIDDYAKKTASSLTNYILHKLSVLPGLEQSLKQPDSKKSIEIAANAYNRIKDYAIKDILGDNKDSIEQTKSILRWLAVLKHCTEHGDFFTGSAIFSALNDSYLAKFTSMKTVLSSMEVADFLAKMDSLYNPSVLRTNPELTEALNFPMVIPAFTSHLGALESVTDQTKRQQFINKIITYSMMAKMATQDKVMDEFGQALDKEKPLTNEELAAIQKNESDSIKAEPLKEVIRANAHALDYTHTNDIAKFQRNILSEKNATDSTNAMRDALFNYQKTLESMHKESPKPELHDTIEFLTQLRKDILSAGSAEERIEVIRKARETNTYTSFLKTQTVTVKEENEVKNITDILEEYIKRYEVSKQVRQENTESRRNNVAQAEGEKALSLLCKISDYLHWLALNLDDTKDLSVEDWDAVFNKDENVDYKDLKSWLTVNGTIPKDTITDIKRLINALSERTSQLISSIPSYNALNDFISDLKGDKYDLTNHAFFKVDDTTPLLDHYNHAQAQLSLFNEVAARQQRQPDVVKKSGAQPTTMVLHGYGEATEQTFTPRAIPLISPGSLKNPHALQSDPDISLEKTLLNEERLTPIKDGRWVVYVDERINDVIIKPNQGDKADEFAKRMLDPQGHDWANIDDDNKPYLDRDPDAILVLKTANGNIITQNPEQARITFRKMALGLPIDGTPLVFYAPKVGKIIALNDTTLSEISNIMHNKLHFNNSVVLATGNHGANEAVIQLDKDSQETIKPTDLVEPIKELRKTERQLKLQLYELYKKVKKIKDDAKSMADDLQALKDKLPENHDPFLDYFIDKHIRLFRDIANIKTLSFDKIKSIYGDHADPYDYRLHVRDNLPANVNVDANPTTFLDPDKFIIDIDDAIIEISQFFQSSEMNELTKALSAVNTVSSKVFPEFLQEVAVHHNDAFRSVEGVSTSDNSKSFNSRLANPPQFAGSVIGGKKESHASEGMLAEIQKLLHGLKMESLAELTGEARTHALQYGASLNALSTSNSLQKEKILYLLEILSNKSINVDTARDDINKINIETTQSIIDRIAKSDNDHLTPHERTVKFIQSKLDEKNLSPDDLDKLTKMKDGLISIIENTQKLEQNNSLLSALKWIKQQDPNLDTDFIESIEQEIKSSNFHLLTLICHEERTYIRLTGELKVKLSADRTHIASIKDDHTKHIQDQLALRKEWHQNEIKLLIQKISDYHDTYLSTPVNDRDRIDRERIELSKRLIEDLSKLSPGDQVAYIDNILNNKRHIIFKHKNMTKKGPTNLATLLHLIRTHAEQIHINLDPPFQGYSDRATKQGGANSPGPYGGRYKYYREDGKLDHMAMIKLDTTPKGPRPEKVMGEYAAGQLLKAMFTSLNISTDRMAEVSLIQAHPDDPFTLDKDGTKTYLKSIFIPNYQGDFWRTAYGEHFKKKFNKKLEKDFDSAAAFSHKQLIQAYRKQLHDLEKDPSNNPKVQSEILTLSKLIESTTLNEVKKQLREDKDKFIETVITAKLDAMGDKKPAFVAQVFSMIAGRKISSTQKVSRAFKARFIPSNALMDKKKQFAEITAPRLLLSDLGVHCANFGSIKRDTGETELAAIDYGAAFSDFTKDFNPFERPKGTTFYKNHLLDYTPNIYASAEMAEMFIRLGQLPDNTFTASIDQIVNDLQRHYELGPLKDFCIRIGMNERVVKDAPSSDKLGELIRAHFTETLKARQLAMKEHGYLLLIEHCFDKKGNLDKDKLRQHFVTYPELLDFVKQPSIRFNRKYLVTNHRVVLGKVSSLANEISKPKPEPTSIQKTLSRALQTLDPTFDINTITPHDKTFPAKSGATPLVRLKNYINYYEMAKYPDSSHDVMTASITLNNERKEAMFVNYRSNGNASLDDKQLEHINNYSLTLRKLSILAGVTYMLEQSSQYLTADQGERQRLNELIEQWMTKIAETPPASQAHESEKDQVDIFTEELAKQIRAITKQDNTPTIRSIRNAEQYFVAEHNANRVLVFKTSPIDSSSATYQVDVPYNNPLTEDQKKEYLKIHTENPPTWLTAMDAWEKDWLIKRIPTTLEGDWSKFTSIFQSSAMQHLPGIKNARQNFLFTQAPDDAPLVKLSSSFKTATLTPYGMIDEDLDTHSKLNTTQWLDLLTKNAQEQFTSIWGNTLPESIKPLILVNSLLSDTAFASADDKISSKQQEDVASYSFTHKDTVTLITGNEPVNLFRAVAKQGESRWAYTEAVISYANTLHAALETRTDLTEDQKARLAIGKLAITELKNLKKLDELNILKFHIRKRRNFEAFKAAYTAVLAESLGGVVSTNCKSGKDRTGLDELYRHAILLYYQKYDTMPQYTDLADKRSNFIFIYKQLFNSMKAQEAAAKNTPGSLGLKDSAKMLCHDIAKRLSRAYRQSNKRADMNKPDSFLHDEAKQAKERKRARSIDALDLASSSPRLKKYKPTIFNKGMFPKSLTDDELDHRKRLQQLSRKKPQEIYDEIERFYLSYKEQAMALFYSNDRTQLSALDIKINALIDTITDIDPKQTHSKLVDIREKLIILQEKYIAKKDEKADKIITFSHSSKIVPLSEVPRLLQTAGGGKTTESANPSLEDQPPQPNTTDLVDSNSAKMNYTYLPVKQEPSRSVGLFNPCTSILATSVQTTNGSDTHNSKLESHLKAHEINRLSEDGFMIWAITDYENFNALREDKSTLMVIKHYPEEWVKNLMLYRAWKQKQDPDIIQCPIRNLTGHDFKVTNKALAKFEKRLMQNAHHIEALTTQLEIPAARIAKVEGRTEKIAKKNN